MIPVKDAEALILSLVEPLTDKEVLPLEAVHGRILAEPITSALDFPYWDNSAMDGYAVRFTDVKEATPENPIILEIIEEIPAGNAPHKLIKTGQAARIFTGAMMPEGADTVIMQENTEKQENIVKILQAPEKVGSFVRCQGDYYKAENPLLSSGICLNAPEIAVLATAQCLRVPVYRRPQGVIFSTGNELISPDGSLQPGQIIDSNQYALGAFIAQQGAIPLKMGIIPDDPSLLRTTIQRSVQQGDFVLSTGGVSVGDYDYIEGILEELGAHIALRSVAIKPGKPLTVAKFPNGCLYFGIPGNPVSALVTCWRFIKPALKKLSGWAGDPTPQWLNAQLQQPLTSGGQRETYFWGRLQIVAEDYQFFLAKGSQNSANLINLAQINALAVMPVGQTHLDTGERVKALFIDR